MLITIHFLTLFVRGVLKSEIGIFEDIRFRETTTDVFAFDLFT
jgi:hypothetical protein